MSDPTSVQSTSLSSWQDILTVKDDSVLKGAANINEVDYATLLADLEKIKRDNTGPNTAIDTPEVNVVAGDEALYARLAVLDPKTLKPEMMQFMQAFENVFADISADTVAADPSLRPLKDLIDAHRKGDQEVLNGYLMLFGALVIRPDESLLDVQRQFLDLFLKMQGDMRRTLAAISSSASYAEFDKKMEAAAKERAAAHLQMVGQVFQGAVQTASGTAEVGAAGLAGRRGGKAAESMKQQATAIRDGNHANATELAGDAEEHRSASQSLNGQAQAMGMTGSSIGTMVAAPLNEQAEVQKTEGQESGAEAGLRADQSEHFDKAAQQTAEEMQAAAQKIAEMQSANASTLGNIASHV